MTTGGRRKIPILGQNRDNTYQVLGMDQSKKYRHACEAERSSWNWVKEPSKFQAWDDLVDSQLSTRSADAGTLWGHLEEKLALVDAHDPAREPEDYWLSPREDATWVDAYGRYAAPRVPSNIHQVAPSNSSAKSSERSEDYKHEQLVTAFLAAAKG